MCRTSEHHGSLKGTLVASKFTVIFIMLKKYFINNQGWTWLLSLVSFWGYPNQLTLDTGESQRFTGVCQIGSDKENMEIKWESILWSLLLSLKTKSRAPVKALIQNDKVSVLKLLQMNRTPQSLLCSLGNKCKILSTVGKVKWHLKGSFIQQAYIDYLLGAGHTEMTMTWSQIYVASNVLHYLWIKF